MKNKAADEKEKDSGGLGDEKANGEATTRDSLLLQEQVILGLTENGASETFSEAVTEIVENEPGSSREGKKKAKYEPSTRDSLLLQKQVILGVIENGASEAFSEAVTETGENELSTNIHEGEEFTGDTQEFLATAYETPMPALMRQTETDRRAQGQPLIPGAYANTPGRQGTLRLRSAHDLETGEDFASQALDMPMMSRDLDDSRQGLAEAVPVNDEENLEGVVRAHEVDRESLERSRNDRRKHQISYKVAGSAIMTIAAIVVVAVIIVRRRQQGGESQPISPPFDGTGSNVTVASNNTDPPTYTPTAAPTDILTDLPDSTRLALMDPMSPQSRARGWVANYPNVAVMDEWRKRQLFALATFFYSFNGEEWEPEALRSDWMDVSRSECDWYSDVFSYLEFDFVTLELVVRGYNTNETICDQDGRLRYLNLTVTGGIIGGTMPPEISLLTSLEAIHFTTITYGGPISNMVISELGLLSNLRELDLHTNGFTGTVPSFIFDPLSKLEKLSLGFNKLNFTLPSQVAAMSSLKELSITANDMSGLLPSEIGKLLLLETLDVELNSFSGTIPEVLFNLEHLETLDLRRNAFEGSISASIARLSNTLTFLDVGYNMNLSGTIPSELGLLTALRRLSLPSCGLDGPLPEQLGLLTELRGFSVHGNSMTGTMEPLASLSNLRELIISTNLFSGTIPLEVSAMKALNSLSLANNLFSGSIATDLGLLTDMELLYLGNNRLVGSIPTEISSLSKLLNLEVAENSLSGTISTSIAKLSKSSLVHLELNNNNISGPIPSELGLLTCLTDLYMDNNAFNGQIPSTWGSLKSLSILTLHNNPDLTGTIPTTLADLNELSVLTLNATGLLGVVPKELCALRPTSLETIAINCSRVDCDCNCTCHVT